MTVDTLPRRPVLGWQTWAGPAEADLPCVLDLPGRQWTTSGSAAIYQALRALKVGPGDSVLVPTYHCPTMISPVHALGAQPRFYGLDAQGTAQPAALEPLLAGVRPKAVLAVHLFGLPRPMAALREWCDANDIALIEDCAHCLFGTVEGRPVGRWGDFAIASVAKFLPVPRGGCVIDTSGRVSALPSRPAKGASRVALDMLDLGHRHRGMPGLNAVIGFALGAARRLRPAAEARASASKPAMGSDPLQAPGYRFDAPAAERAVDGVSRWLAERAPQGRNAATRRRNFARLAEGLDSGPGRRLLWPEARDASALAGFAPYAMPLWLDDPEPAYAAMRKAMLPVMRWDRLWPGTPALPGDHGLTWARHVVQIACHQSLEDAQVDRIVVAVRRACGETEGRP